LVSVIGLYLKKNSGSGFENQTPFQNQFQFFFSLAQMKKFVAKKKRTTKDPHHSGGAPTSPQRNLTHEAPPWPKNQFQFGS
jgi:hypothetical protein